MQNADSIDTQPATSTPRPGQPTIVMIGIASRQQRAAGSTSRLAGRGFWRHLHVAATQLARASRRGRPATCATDVSDRANGRQGQVVPARRRSRSPAPKVGNQPSRTANTEISTNRRDEGRGGAATEVVITSTALVDHRRPEGTPTTPGGQTDHHDEDRGQRHPHQGERDEHPGAISPRDVGRGTATTVPKSPVRTSSSQCQVLHEERVVEPVLGRGRRRSPREWGERPLHQEARRGHRARRCESENTRNDETRKLPRLPRAPGSPVAKRSPSPGPALRSQEGGKFHQPAAPMCAAQG